MLHFFIFINYVVTTMLKDDTNQETGQDLTLTILISFINVVSHKFVNFHLRNLLSIW